MPGQGRRGKKIVPTVLGAGNLLPQEKKSRRLSCFVSLKLKKKKGPPFGLSKRKRAFP